MWRNVLILWLDKSSALPFRFFSFFIFSDLFTLHKSTVHRLQRYRENTERKGSSKQQQEVSFTMQEGQPGRVKKHDTQGSGSAWRPPRWEKWRSPTLKAIQIMNGVAVLALRLLRHASDQRLLRLGHALLPLTMPFSREALAQSRIVLPHAVSLS